MYGNELNSITHTAGTAGTASTQILAANTSRAYAHFVNDSDEAIYLNLGGAAAVNTGVRINSAGGSYTLTPADGNLFTGAVTAVSSSGGKLVLVTEGTH